MIKLFRMAFHEVVERAVPTRDQPRHIVPVLLICGGHHSSTSDFGLRTLDSRLRTQDFRLRTLDSGRKPSDSGLWTQDSGLKLLDFRLWTLDSRLLMMHLAMAVGQNGL